MNSSAELTVVIPTSWIPTHPSTAIIERSVRSIRHVLGLKSAQLVIGCDGLDEAEKCRADLDRYRERLRHLVEGQSEFSPATLVELPVTMGLPGVIMEAFRHVQTRCVLVFQHDVEVVRSIDVQGILSAILLDGSPVKYVRINHRRNIAIKSDYILKEFSDPRVAIPLLRTSSWSDMPHFTTAEYYRLTVLPLLKAGRGSRGVENKVAAVYWENIERDGFDKAQSWHGTFLYGNLGDPPVVRHLDGRKTLRLPASWMSESTPPLSKDNMG